MNTVVRLIMLASLFVVAIPFAGLAATVSCPTDSLQSAVDAASVDEVIEVSGTCNESILIEKDRLTIDGTDASTTTLNGGGSTVVTINAARGVVIKNVTLTGGGRGLLAQRGAEVELSDLIVNNNASQGIRIDLGSTAALNNISSTENGSHGIRISENSSAALTGTLTSSKNGSDGIQVLFSSRAVFRAVLVANENADDGLSLGFGASVSFNGNADQSRTIEAKGNAKGITLTSASSLVLFNMPVTLNNNTQYGMSVSDGSSALLQDSDIEASNNTTEGLSVLSNSNILHSGGFGSGDTATLTVDGNETGLLVDGSSQFSTDPSFGNVVLSATNNGQDGVSAKNGAVVEIKGATIETNNRGVFAESSVLTMTDSQVDTVFIDFGTRATFTNTMAGAINCGDGSPLIRGAQCGN